MHPDEPDLDRPPSPADPSRLPADASGPPDGAPRPDPGLPPPAEAATPVPDVPAGDEGARQTAATLRSVTRLEEAN